MDKLTLTGKDNYGKPRQEYADKLAAMDGDALFQECLSKIWLSAFANNNPRSDYHWQCDACYDECKRRDISDTYDRAYRKVVKDNT